MGIENRALQIDDTPFPRINIEPLPPVLSVPVFVRSLPAEPRGGGKTLLNSIKGNLESCLGDYSGQLNSAAETEIKELSQDNLIERLKPRLSQGIITRKFDPSTVIDVWAGGDFEKRNGFARRIAFADPVFSSSSEIESLAGESGMRNQDQAWAYFLANSFHPNELIEHIAHNASERKFDIWSDRKSGTRRMLLALNLQIFHRLRKANELVSFNNPYTKVDFGKEAVNLFNISKNKIKNLNKDEINRQLALLSLTTNLYGNLGDIPIDILWHGLSDRLLPVDPIDGFVREFNKRNLSRTVRELRRRLKGNDRDAIGRIKDSISVLSFEGKDAGYWHITEAVRADTGGEIIDIIIKKISDAVEQEKEVSPRVLYIACAGLVDSLDTYNLKKRARLLHSLGRAKLLAKSLLALYLRSEMDEQGEPNQMARAAISNLLVSIEQAYPKLFRADNDILDLYVDAKKKSHGKDKYSLLSRSEEEAYAKMARILSR